jgi:hypothetical protein
LLFEGDSPAAGFQEAATLSTPPANPSVFPDFPDPFSIEPGAPDGFATSFPCKAGPDALKYQGAGAIHESPLQVRRSGGLEA